MHGCNNICLRYKSKKPKENKSRYEDGQKFCTGCSIFVRWEGLWCPCCGYMLKRGPKSRRFRNKLNLNTS